MASRVCRPESSLSWSTDRARFGAGAAFDAGLSVDFVLAVAFTDRRNGAFSGTGAAADAFIRNFVSHDPYLQILFARIVFVLIR